MKISDIARLIDGKVRGDPDIEIKRLARIEEAKEGDITYLSHPRYKKWLSVTKASCIIVPKDFPSLSVTTIETENPALTFIKLTKEFFKPNLPEKAVSSLAFISDSRGISDNVSIGAFTFIGKRVVIKDGVILFPEVFIGDGVEIGEDSILYPGVIVRDGVKIGKRVIIHPGTVLGADGFGYIEDNGERVKIPQAGGVIIQDYVEIGANCTIDRATLGNTIIKRGTKIDNLVHIAHNVVIGENSVIVAQVGIAGSTEIGSRVTIAGQAGISDHLKIEDNVTIAAQTGVARSLKKGSIVSGYPARPHKLSRKAYALLIRLPELFKRVKTLEKVLFKKGTGRQGDNFTAK